jgi:hypothetical protein
MIGSESLLRRIVEEHLSKLGDDDEWPTELPVGRLEDGRSDVHEDEA